MRWFEDLDYFDLSNWGAWLGVLTLACVLGYWIAFPSPETVTVDSKYWECKAALPKGIKSECIRLEKKL